MAYLLPGLLVALLAAFASLATTSTNIAKAYRKDSLAFAHARLADAVSNYTQYYGSPPATMATLVAVPGNEYLKPYVVSASGGFFNGSRDRLAFSSTTSRTDSWLTYARVAVVAQDDFSESLASYMGTGRNSCPPASGATDFANATAWCGDKRSNWVVQDTRQAANRLMGAIQTRQLAIRDKFVRRYKTLGSFPAVASATPLKNLVTPVSTSIVGSSALQCYGMFSYMGIPLECGDLYNAYGNPINYQLVSAKSISLTSVSGVKNSLGSFITMTTTITMP